MAVTSSLFRLSSTPELSGLSQILATSGTLEKQQLGVYQGVSLRSTIKMIAAVSEPLDSVLL
jgi:hypothetical protein